MFGTRLKTIEPIREAVATYVTRACEKLRAQGSLCKRIRVSIRTGMFNPDEAKYAKSILWNCPIQTIPAWSFAMPLPGYSMCFGRATHIAKQKYSCSI